MESEAKTVVQVPADVNISDLPVTIKAGEIFYVSTLPYVCEENDCPGLLVADRGEDGLTTVPETVKKFFVIRQVLQ